jgi:hypothetical protein
VTYRKRPGQVTVLQTIVRTSRLGVLPINPVGIVIRL